MTPGERERADAMDVRCLDLCIGMLERVNGVSNLCLLFILCQLTNWGSLTDVRRKLDFGGYPRRADRACCQA
jgi:hypothetical protein